jgi:predicted phage terminase large subunit-like protein
LLSATFGHIPTPRDCYNTSDFISEEIVSIEPDGIEDVFDIEVVRTGNFIANGIVSHNTRWHEDDLAGRLLIDEKEKDADKWRVISFPAIAEENDVLGRTAGEALWPKRFPLKHLQATQRANPPRYWASLYQQKPRPDEGTMFKNKYFRYFTIKDLRNPQEVVHLDKRNSQTSDEQSWTHNGKTYMRTGKKILIPNYDKRPVEAEEYVEVDEIVEIQGDFVSAKGGERFYELNAPEGIKRVRFEDCMVFQTIDTAATERTYSDFFVVATWAMTPERDLLLLDIYREQAETTKHLDILTTQRLKWNPAFQGVENRTYGLSLIQSARILGFPIKELEADVDKVSRALTMKTRYEMGTVYHLVNASWLYDYETELTSFPNAKHDDMVDCASYAGILLGTLPIPRFI